MLRMTLSLAAGKFLLYMYSQTIVMRLIHVLISLFYCHPFLFSDVYVYTCRKRTGGGKTTRPLACLSTNVKPLSRSSSNEENEATIAKMAPLKMSPRDKVESRALTQVQVPVVNC